MVIAFWSNVKGKSGVTSNLACISVQAALEGRSCVLLENHFNINNMGDILASSTRLDYLKEDYAYQKVGLEPLIRQLQCDYSIKDIKRNYSVSYLGNKIFYLPQSQWMNQELFDYEFCQVLKPMLRELRNTGDTILVDTCSDNQVSTKAILEEADIIAVNLNQNPFIMEHYFNHYSSFMEKSIFLLGHYEEKSRYNQKTILKKYPICKEKIAVIPYYASFGEALGEGRVIHFFQDNYKNKKKKEGQFFFQGVKEASDMVWNTCQNMEKMNMTERIAGEEVRRK